MNLSWFKMISIFIVLFNSFGVLSGGTTESPMRTMPGIRAENGGGGGSGGGNGSYGVDGGGLLQGI
ncbi:unnamed protein product [Spirodela intermedia]|uniref:Uncharacterized protein n=1 Tax=Spirodela intermedia TaxID=51605 RepID=A0A7I8JJT6_SPIIN|nr:unnamed protein product [Spirodela intermedia]CAA6670408.1 unnamed protein product [Spirodela intermedia]